MIKLFRNTKTYDVRKEICGESLDDFKIGGIGFGRLTGNFAIRIGKNDKHSYTLIIEREGAEYLADSINRLLNR